MHACVRACVFIYSSIILSNDNDCQLSIVISQSTKLLVPCHHFEVDAIDRTEGEYLSYLERNLVCEKTIIIILLWCKNIIVV